MDISVLTINKEDYDVVDSINIDGKDYLAYSKDDCIYVSEYIMHDDTLELKKVSDDTLHMVLDKLNISVEE